ncbi:hypothetical protein POTOM_027945 [Populus tomentosa]|uniref:Uncharacterized protein n=1 Tax=Populus tomentosa TaxID=118781 RepID=A0A8X7ZFN3_POPTO|nr:hypothetical protein POTOM_027945 [Populus tomentosa]
MAAFALEYAKILPSTTSLLSWYVSFSTFLVLLRNTKIVPEWIHFGDNELVKSAEYYLSSRIGPEDGVVRVAKFD